MEVVGCLGNDLPGSGGLGGAAGGGFLMGPKPKPPNPRKNMGNPDP